MKIFSAVEIEINSHCNMSCNYCPNSVSERIEKGFMSKALYEKIIQQLREINFTGRISYDFYNEPTLAPDLIFFIYLAKKELPNSKIELYSNGTKIDMPFFIKLEKAGVDKFIITKHENITNYLFNETFSNLSQIQLKKVLFRTFREIHFTNRGGALKNIHGKTSTNFLPCHLPSMMLTITNQGNIIPCFEDFYQKNIMGNISDSSLLEIWNSKKYISFRNHLLQGLRHKFEACKSCSRTETNEEQV